MFSDLNLIIAGVSAIAAVASAIFAFLPYITDKRNEKILSKEFGTELFPQDVISRATKFYIRPNCTSVDPSYEQEMRNVVATEEPLFDVMDRFLARDSNFRHLLLLADSGMGKTSALLNYYALNQRRSRRRRYRLAVIPLGIPDADSFITSITQKRKTILFLDAFDEDTRAIHDHFERLSELMSIAKEFYKVVITSRTQFFPRDEEIPADTGIARVGPRKAGVGSTYEFLKLYLAPLSNRQVQRYIHRRYPIWKLAQRREAFRLVASVSALTARPMLLAFLPDLLESSEEFRTSAAMYEALVDSWLKRENRWVEPQNLREFSERLAVDLFLNREERGAERIPRKALADLAAEWSIPLDDWQLSGRSLLNRDAVGNYKFSHRTILEYLFVNRLFRGEWQCWVVEWTEQMSRFYREIMAEETRGYPKTLVLV